MNESQTCPAVPCTDAVALHMRALNSLSRCKHMLMANEPMYTFALNDLEAAKQALLALTAMEAPHAACAHPCN